MLICQKSQIGAFLPSFNFRRMCDVEPQQYPTVIREMIRHENDLTNHRVMWLLIAQGLIANAFVPAKKSTSAVLVLSLVGILVTLSTFVILYKSYQARGYLQFLGTEAKLGRLSSQDLPLYGWPQKRVKDWRKHVWICPWIGHASDLLEPYLFLPVLITYAWLFVLLRYIVTFDWRTVLALTLISVVAIFSLFCVVWVWMQNKDEEVQLNRNS
jgi:hypothetical protein